MVSMFFSNILQLIYYINAKYSFLNIDFHTNSYSLINVPFHTLKHPRRNIWIMGYLQVFAHIAKHCYGSMRGSRNFTRQRIRNLIYVVPMVGWFYPITQNLPNQSRTFSYKLIGRANIFKSILDLLTICFPLHPWEEEYKGK